jgi:hypothetical protein
MVVPQGTVLGPISFIIMIDDLLKEWESRWKYVDDTTLSETVAVNDQISPANCPRWNKLVV